MAIFILNTKTYLLLHNYSEWTEMFPYDFRDERMMKQLKDLTQKIIKLYPELRKDVGIITHNLLAKVSAQPV